MPTAQELSDQMSVGLWMSQHKGVPGTTSYDRNIPGLPPPGYVWTGDHWESPTITEPKLTSFATTDPYGGFFGTVQGPQGTYSYGRTVQAEEIAQNKREAMYAVSRNPRSILRAWLTPEEAKEAESGDWKTYAARLTPWEMYQWGILKKDPLAGIPHETDLTQPAPVGIDPWARALTDLQEQGIELPGFAQTVYQHGAGDPNVPLAHYTAPAGYVAPTPIKEYASPMPGVEGVKIFAPGTTFPRTQPAPTTSTSGAVQNLMNVSNQQLWGGTATLPKATSTPTPKSGPAFGTSNAIDSLLKAKGGTMDLWDYRKPFGA